LVLLLLRDAAVWVLVLDLNLNLEKLLDGFKGPSNGLGHVLVPVMVVVAVHVHDDGRCKRIAPHIDPSIRLETFMSCRPTWW